VNVVVPKITLGEITQKQQDAAIKLQTRLKIFVAKKKRIRLVIKKIERTKAVRELVETERTYNFYLDLLVKKYVLPLRAVANTKKPILSNDNIKKVFGNVEIISNLHKVILDQMEAVIKNSEKKPKLALIFLTLSDYFKVYTSYITNYNIAIATVHESSIASDKFAQFMENLQKRDPEIKNFSLDAFLIMPIQRMPRYNMLLERIVKTTWDKHSEYNSLCNALREMQKLTSGINERKREAENKGRIMEIQSSLKCDTRLELVIPSRRLIKEGCLTQTAVIGGDVTVPDLKLLAKLSNTISKKSNLDSFRDPKKIPTMADLVYCFLFNDTIVFAKPSSKSYTTLLSNSQRQTNKNVDLKSLKFIKQCSLKNISAENVDGIGYKNYFKLNIANENPLFFMVDTEEQKQLWVTEINNCIDVLTEFGKTMIERSLKSSENKAAQFKKIRKR